MLGDRHLEILDHFGNRSAVIRFLVDSLAEYVKTEDGVAQIDALVAANAVGDGLSYLDLRGARQRKQSEIPTVQDDAPNPSGQVSGGPSLISVRGNISASQP